MQLHEGIDGLKHLPPGTSISIGNFDGIHRGHLAILERAQQLQQTSAGARAGVAVVTFEPHPLTVLRPAIAPPRLTPLPLKSALLQQHGVEHLVVLPPSPEVLNLTAEAFWSLLRDEARPAHLIEGNSFRFGQGGRGTIEQLQQWTRSSPVRLHVLDPVRVPLLDCHVVDVSSSLVRWLLLQGRVRDAAICIGRPFELEGGVVQGFQRGRTIGVPTANLDCGEQLVPAPGVYAGRALVDGVLHSAAVSVGTMPTFGEHRQQVEVHLLDFAGDLYGRTLRVQLVDWVRDQRKFSGVDELVKQLRQDLKHVRRRAGLVAEKPVVQSETLQLAASPT